jgi:hypothetical protein
LQGYLQELCVLAGCAPVDIVPSCDAVCVVQGQMRWIVAQKNRVRNGELYRFIADSKGAFVQVRTLAACKPCASNAVPAGSLRM